MKKLTFITGNSKKAEQLALHFAIPVEHTKLDLEEIQSLDMEAITIDKARRAYDILKSPVLVEDTSLTFHALGSLPGPLIKWFLTSLGNEKMCHLLDSYEDRSATAEVCFCIYDEHGHHTFRGQIQGTIGLSPKGDTGFGFDPIFIPDGYDKSWGEMNAEEQAATSMRKIALAKLTLFLNEQK